MKSSRVFYLFLVIAAIAIFFFVTRGNGSELASPVVDSVQETEASSTPPKVATHLKTPENVRGIYVSAFSFITPSFRTKLDALLETTSINAIVIDIKDAPGTIMYDIGFDHPCVEASMGKEELEKNLEYYHGKGIYIIARVAVFRDACFTKLDTTLAVQDKVGNPWRDAKGNYWLAPHEQKTREYIKDLSLAVYERGFDEIQLDYVRYPSDGAMANVQYEYTDTISATSTALLKRRATMADFFKYMRAELGNIPLSADVFGMVLTNNDDLTIGQHLDDIAPHVDYISAMIYPSHFPKQWNGIADTNRNPYQTIYGSTYQGLQRLKQTHGTSTAIQLMRPWLQDFSIYGVVYNAPEVKAQIKALEDLGIKSFLLWNASNRYTPGVL